MRGQGFLPSDAMRVCGTRSALTLVAPEDHLTWHHTTVDGRPAAYGVGGPVGPPVFFLHGWALGSRAYKRAIRRLTSRGCRVYAPALPSFGGTADLPAAAMDITGYAAWVSSFMEVVGIDEPALVIGHSFGGGIAIKLAHTRPDLVRYLVLLNSVGGVAPRPPIDWVAGFGREVWPLSEGIEMARAMRARPSSRATSSARPFAWIVRCSATCTSTTAASTSPK